jgi:adenosylcobyric acid synthase
MLLEGAGSPAEINLREHDIVNMRYGACCRCHLPLVGDIDRGGVFASLLGTLELLNPKTAPASAASFINKFRGDKSLLWPGV